MEALPAFEAEMDTFQMAINEQQEAWEEQEFTNRALKRTGDRHATLSDFARHLVSRTDTLSKLASRLVEICETECDAKSSTVWNGGKVMRARKSANETRRRAVEQLKQVLYFWRQGHWLTTRFPEAALCDVEGLVKLVDRAEIEAKDWSLTPSRYVGIAPEEEDEDFDFEEALREVHMEMEDLNIASATLAITIKENFEGLGV